MKVISLYPNHKRLIKRAKKGDSLAQKEIFTCYSPKMLSVCRMYIKDIQFAEDVLLRGFYKVFKNLSSYAFKGSFEGWIRRIMVREAIDFLRSEKGLDCTDKAADRMELSTNPVETNTEADYLQELIDQLPEGYKLVFVLVAIEGYKHREIAKMLGISEGTSKSQLFKARKLLQQQLKKEKSEYYGV